MGVVRTQAQTGISRELPLPSMPALSPYKIQMKKIEFKSNYGRFEYKMTAMIGDEVNAATEQLCLQGLANIGYRIAGSNVDKGLGAKVRKEVEWSEQTGEQINGFVATALKKLEEKEGSLLRSLKLDFAVTGEYQPSSAGPSESKEAKDMWAVIAALAPEKKANALEKLGLEAGFTEEEAISAVHAKLKAAKAAAKLAAMGGLGL